MRLSPIHDEFGDATNRCANFGISLNGQDVLRTKILGSLQKVWNTLRNWWRNFIGRIRKCQAGLRLNDEERFSFLWTSKRKRFFTLLDRVQERKMYIVLNEAFEGEASKEGAHVRHAGIH